MKETYVGREDCLICMEVTFGMVDKVFGPADEEEIRSTRKILKILERLVYLLVFFHTKKCMHYF